MKRLSQQGTAIFKQFLEKLENSVRTEISIPGHPVLIITRGGRRITTVGAGFLYELGLIADKRKNTFQYWIQFIVIDNPITTIDSEYTLIFPIMFRDDVNGVAEITCQIIEGIVLKVYSSQAQLTVKADRWLLDLQSDGYSTGQPT